MNTPVLPVLFDKDDVAFHIRVSRNHVDTMERKKQLPPSCKMGSAKRWKSAEIQAWVDAGMPSVNEESAAV